MVTSDRLTCMRVGAPRRRRRATGVAAARRREHLDVLPEHAARVPGSERLHRRLFRREASGQVRHGIAAPRTIGNLAVGEDAAQESVAVALERLAMRGMSVASKPSPRMFMV